MTTHTGGDNTRHCRMVGLEARVEDQEGVDQLILVEGTDYDQKEEVVGLLRQRINPVNKKRYPPFYSVI